MQQKRNKAAIDAPYLYQYARTHGVTDADLIELLEGWVPNRALDGDLPLMDFKCWQRVIACAKAGVNKGRGKHSGRPPDTYYNKLLKQRKLELTVEFAQRRKAERFQNARVYLLQAKRLPKERVRDRELLEKKAAVEGINKTGLHSAEDKAIEDARKYAQEKFGWAPAASTIRRKMKSSS